MVGVINHGMGNSGSVLNMLRYLGIPCMLSSDTTEVSNCSSLILPGVGAFDQGMRALDRSGLKDCLTELVMDQHRPILGICLGMQMLTRCSQEGVLPGLGWIEADTLKFDPAEMKERLPVPHMGWNQVEPKQYPEWFMQRDGESRFYFVHSYYVRCDHQEDVLTETTYGMRFASGLRHGNICGVQFHPEKSHRFGMQFLHRWFRAVSEGGQDVS